MAGHRKLKSGKIQIIITHGTDIQGKPKRYYKTIDKCSKKQLEIEDAKFLNEILKGLPEAGRNMKIGDLYTDFRRHYCVDLKASTTARYDTLYTQHVEPYFGRRKISDITRADVRDWVADLLSTPTARDSSRMLAEKTIKNTLGLLRVMLNYAIYDLELIEKNPCLHVTVKRKEVEISNVIRMNGERVNEPEQGRYSEDECIELIKVLMDARHTSYASLRHVTLITMILFTGLRTAEVMGLRWPDIDFTNRTISIERNRVHVPGKGSVLNTTKTESSIRTISAPAIVTDLLTELKKAQQYNAETLGKGYHYSGYISSLETGEPQNPRATYDWFKGFQKKNGFRKCSVHDLRHAHAAMLSGLGVQIIDISKRLGHSNTRVTQEVYEYLFRDNDNEISNELDRYYKSVIPENDN